MNKSVLTPSVVDDSESRESVRELLRAINLPFEDIQFGKGVFVRYYQGENMIGSGGLEFYYPYALLRSLAIVESERGKSLGGQIVKDLQRRAQEVSVQKVFLLTETAQGFFARNGFVEVPRKSVPAEVQASSEFSSVCPTSATCMVYEFAKE